MPHANGSQVSELLRWMLIPDEDERERLERAYAAKIRVGPFGRYGCRLLMQGHLIQFKLIGMPGDNEEFVVTKDGIPFTGPETKQDIFKLARHRAAEVMLGLRAGHTEYNLRRKRRTPKPKAGT